METKEKGEDAHEKGRRYTADLEPVPSGRREAGAYQALDRNTTTLTAILT